VAILLTTLAVAVRLLWVLVVPTRPVGDFAMYLESAAHLVAHGAFDPEFIYMPGYVFALAGVQALGGGVFAAKLLGVAAGGLATAAVTGVTARLFDRTSALVAGLLCALWPAGIAVASVTGTDMPAAALLIAAVWLLLRDAPTRPWRAAVLFGFVLGLAATIRAVALPLAFFAAPLWWSMRTPLRRILQLTALSGAVALLTLVPWGLRNQRRYGEFFLTDSHGGHTALVGANPNSEGVYSRSLNQVFARGTEYKLFAPPHREADRAAYALAKAWAAFEPDYAWGLLGAKADRLLTHERPLLYWPLYRQGVLAAARPSLVDWFARHRAGLEGLVDGFWYALVGAALAGIVVSASRRLGPALALLPIPLALTGIYVLFFAEVRYHLAIAVFLFPYAGLGWRWLVQGVRDAAWRRFTQRGRLRFLRETALALAVLLAVFAGWPRLVEAAAELRERHRWAASVCQVAGRGRICLWRATIPAPGEGPSGVRGVWDGLGLQVSTSFAAAATDVALPAGRYRVSLRADTVVSSSADPDARLDLRANGVTLASVSLPAPAGTPPARLTGIVDHAGGNLRVELYAERIWPSPLFVRLPTLWASDLKIETEVHSCIIGPRCDPATR
jgi:4-amino-4-deoxy-L-arabinose transferase-like glycosyltransferase